jgi:hypothetical protein
VETKPQPVRSTDSVLADVDDILQAREPSVTVPIDAIDSSYSPRVNGESEDHVRVLTNAETVLPPILVHRPTMRVIDGMHRLRAAVRKGARTIQATFFDGSEELAFALAVKANMRHGLPLSLADRKVAAQRLLNINATCSDRYIAAVTGLAPATIRDLRACTTDQDAQSTSRVGRDGRIRPLDHARRRVEAAKVLLERPDASLREIAKIVGVSHSTVRDVRRQMEQGSFAESVRTATRRSVARRPRRLGVDGIRDRRMKIVNGLRNDPALRYTETGRAFLRWLDGRLLGPDGWEAHLANIPAHSAYLMVDLASICAAEWGDFADRLRDVHLRSETSGGG